MIENPLSRTEYPMTRRLEIKSLQSKEEMEQAYPLIQSIAPDLSLESWLEFACDIGDMPPTGFGPCGIVAAQSGRGYIHGLYTYMVEPDLRHGRILNVDNFVAFDLANRWNVVRKLLAAMDEQADRYGCKAIHVRLPDRLTQDKAAKQTLLAKFHDHGHDVRSLGLCKDLAVTWSDRGHDRVTRPATP